MRLASKGLRVKQEPATFVEWAQATVHRFELKKLQQQEFAMQPTRVRELGDMLNVREEFCYAAHACTGAWTVEKSEAGAQLCSPRVYAMR